MRVPVKLLGLGFWLFFSNCAQCQVCLRDDIKYENTELTEKASYTNGETVRVSCTTGYTGSYKLKCENGQWKKLVGRSCAKKKCNHPGDTPHSDFKLTEGAEFVFGATVVYTCHKGYEMTSRINQRTCRAQGWDNTVPICEVVKCPVIRTDGDVMASGNTEEGSYGDVIHFECVSSDKMIDGSKDIHCEETGRWSDIVPKCKDIKCTAPVISNGYVIEPLPEYQKDAILKYSCNPGFKKREGIPRCIQFGWTLNPECDEVTCELKSTTFGIKKISPEGQTTFRAGESVDITCSENYRLINTKKNRNLCTCQYNGEWDQKPICEEIKCEVPHDQNVYRPYDDFRGDKKLGEKIYYRCNYWYHKMAEEATCTQDGWTPKPLCAEKVCTKPKIPNAEIVGLQQQNYMIYAIIQYQCHSGFEPEEPVPITCDYQAQWTNIRQCTEKQKLCPVVSVENGFIYSHSSNKENLFYSCDTGYKPFTGNWWDSVTCSKGSWSDKPRCIPEEECGALPSVHHGQLKQTKQTFRDGETTEFECDPGFISTHRFIKCTNGTWEKPVCKEVHCKIPLKVENAVITSKPQEIYLGGSKVMYTCRSSYSMIGESLVFCRDGSWGKAPKCQAVTCELKSTTFGIKKINPEGKNIFRAGESVDITCSDNYRFTDTKKNRQLCTCQYDGEWDQKPVCEEATCSLQWNTTEDLKIEGLPDIEGPVKPGHRLNFSCIGERLKLNGQREIFCESKGEWSSPFPKCEEAICVANLTANMRSDGHTGPEVSVRPGHTITLSCVATGSILQGQSKITCLPNGEWDAPVPKCLGQVPGKCGQPPHVNFSDTVDLTKEYNAEEKVEYICVNKYTLDLRPPFSKYLTCVKGEWRGNIKCLEPCTVTKEIMDERGIELAYGNRKKMFAPHEDHITFMCKRGKASVGIDFRPKCNDGVMTLPECRDVKSTQKLYSSESTDTQ